MFSHPFCPSNIHSAPFLRYSEGCARGVFSSRSNPAMWPLLMLPSSKKVESHDGRKYKEYHERGPESECHQPRHGSHQPLPTTGLIVQHRRCITVVPRTTPGHDIIVSVWFSSSPDIRPNASCERTTLGVSNDVLLVSHEWVVRRWPSFPCGSLHHSQEVANARRQEARLGPHEFPQPSTLKT